MTPRFEKAVFRSALRVKTDVRRPLLQWTETDQSLSFCAWTSCDQGLWTWPVRSDRQIVNPEFFM